MLTALVAALRLDGLAAPMVIDGAMNGDAFTAYPQPHISVITEWLRHTEKASRSRFRAVEK